MITQHREMIGHREDQITENEALLNQCNIVVEYLQEQVQDLTLEFDDDNAYIEFLQVPPGPPEMKKKIPRRLKEFLNLTLSMKV